MVLTTQKPLHAPVAQVPRQGRLCIGVAFEGSSSSRAFLVAQMVKNSRVMQQTWVRSLGQEHPLEKGMAIHSSILAWKIRGARWASP